ncbi:VOC family protein [Granulosicoccus antarcticus]|uniref:VOC domain-containing protein n=1 Tax=Granulosicoccus antarcticus IMCC3135 TaxID=1192854 RepID=A0A2Z2NLT2_9GAMM|nr:VOC family protein [Granulosicoccus antarcticus]ASJ71505.1 hypothetical protein IMCC3135_06995 [Granulosicoccus antarcticus IMCC3135]
MTEKNPSIISHVSLGTNDLAGACTFYDNVLSTLGIERIETLEGMAAAYGRQFPEFWIALPENDEKATVGNGVHIGFIAESREAVQAFHKAALSAGGTDAGAPGPRPHYGEPYYGCFIVDPDGNKIEATFWDGSVASV